MFHSLYLVRRVPTCQLEQELARFLYRKRRKMSKSSSIFPQRVPEQFFLGTGNEASYTFLPLVTAILPFMTAYVAQGPEVLSAIHLSNMTFSDHHGKAGAARRRACIPKTTEAKHIPDIRHILGSGSLLQIVKV
jgi:hypothetical protein